MAKDARREDSAVHIARITAREVIMVAAITPVITRIFVDSVALHRWWHCHRSPERSFKIRGRQFHVCARCTGLICGLTISPLLVPWRDLMPTWFALCCCVLLADGLTQLLGWRESTNALRFLTGLSVGALSISGLLGIQGL